jgi:hypothetical protein
LEPNRQRFLRHRTKAERTEAQKSKEDLDFFFVFLDFLNLTSMITISQTESRIKQRYRRGEYVLTFLFFLGFWTSFFLHGEEDQLVRWCNRVILKKNARKIEISILTFINLSFFVSMKRKKERSVDEHFYSSQAKFHLLYNVVLSGLAASSSELLRERS